LQKDFWKNINKPIIGLAPMDGYSDSAFRRVCKYVNPSIITYTEFTSADGLHFNSKKLEKKLGFHKDEKPIIAQIFGKNIETFITATKICEDMGFDGIDINMGCPAKKVIRSQHGMALRKNPELALKIIETVAKATKLPVSVKTRLGWRNADDLSSFCISAQNAGADMICVHARTYVEPYNVPAHWEPLYDLKKQLSIPLLGNGGIINIKDGLDKCRNLDGFLIGQASFGNPWVFLNDNQDLPFSEKLPVIKLHSKWLIEAKGPEIGCREIRKHLLFYVKNFKGAKKYRAELVRVESLEEINNILDLVVKNHE
jgi:tRNA-dihydrouridine synthase B